MCYPAAMRKTTFVRKFYCRVFLLCLSVLTLASPAVFAQDATPVKETPQAAPAMPTDSKALMLLAAKSNGLTGPDVQPWHLKASFTVLDESGNATDKGTYEEFWANTHKYKIAYTSAAFSQTDYGTEKGVLRAGARESAPELFNQLRSEFINPMPLDEKSIAHATFGLKKHDLGGTKLLCLSENGRSVSAPYWPMFGPSYCLDADIPALRISVHGAGPWASQFVHNNIVSFHDRYLPGDLEDARGGKPLFKAHLEKVEALKTIDDADFTPPADAQPWPPLVTITAAEAQRLHLQQVEPVYPPIAKAAHVEGMVVLQAIIGKDGRVLSVSVISGPLMLQQAALDAVKKWVYRPYLLNNEATEVNTTINVFFPLAGYPHAVP